MGKPDEEGRVGVEDKKGNILCAIWIDLNYIGDRKYKTEEDEK